MSHEDATETRIEGLGRLVGAYRNVRRAGSAIDGRFRRWERRYGHRALRYSLAFVFFWFGITKPLGISPADAVVRPTLAATPVLNELVSFQLFFALLGLWEALVGVGLLWKRTVRLAVACMCLQMASTFLPLVVILGETFRLWPLVPSAVGFYIVKNFALATAGLVVASLDSEPLFGRSRTGWGRGSDAPSPIGGRIDGIEGAVRTALGTTVSRLTVRSLRLGLGVVFIWSGTLMVSASPVPGEWIAAVVPRTLVVDSVFIPLLGVLELAIGLYLLIPGNRATHAAAYLCLGYISLTMLPVVIRPSQVFVTIPFEPTFEGVYIFKDLILVAGVMTVDAYVWEEGLGTEDGSSTEGNDLSETEGRAGANPGAEARTERDFSPSGRFGCQCSYTDGGRIEGRDDEC